MKLARARVDSRLRRERARTWRRKRNLNFSRPLALLEPSRLVELQRQEARRPRRKQQRVVESAQAGWALLVLQLRVMRCWLPLRGRWDARLTARLRNFLERARRDGLRRRRLRIPRR